MCIHGMAVNADSFTRATFCSLRSTVASTLIELKLPFRTIVKDTLRINKTILAHLHSIYEISQHQLVSRASKRITE